MGHAILKDSSGTDRLLYRTDPALSTYNGVTPIEVMVAGPAYSLKARATLGMSDRAPSELLSAVTNAGGNASYELWGGGDYRTEGPLLTLKLVGDKLGHFKARISMAEGDLRFTDEFQTDQSCLSIFVAQLRGIGGDA